MRTSVIKRDDKTAVQVVSVETLSPERRESLLKVYERKYSEEVYLPADHREALHALGLITVTPGRKASRQDDPFHIALERGEERGVNGCGKSASGAGGRRRD